MAEIDSSELNVTGVEISEYRGGIPLSGWQSVEAALETFASGRTKKSRATQQNIEDHVENVGGGIGLGLYFLTLARMDRDSFVGDLLKEAQEALKGRDRWSRHYDYDGLGTVFFKTTVEIDRIPDLQEGYLLGLNAAYVGKEVEDGLSETLGVEQGLHRKSVSVKLEPRGSEFRIDFDKVAEKIHPFYTQIEEGKKFNDIKANLKELKRTLTGKKPLSTELTGENVLRKLLDVEPYSGDTNPFLLGIHEGLEVYFNLGRVGYRFYNERGARRRELWRSEGAILSGPLAKSHNEIGKSEPPSIVFTVRRFSRDRFNRIPAIDPAMKVSMDELANKIAGIFTPQS